MDEKANKLKGWETDIKDWTKLDIDTGKLFLVQAEARLKETVETFNFTSTRADRYLTLASTLLTVSLGVMFGNTLPFLKVTALFSLIPLTIAFYYLWKIYKPVNVEILGLEPKQIFIAEKVDNYESQKQFLNLVFEIMEITQYKIEKNKLTNKVRVQNNMRVLKAIISTPLSFIAAAIYQYLCGYYLVWDHF